VFEQHTKSKASDLKAKCTCCNCTTHAHTPNYQLHSVLLKRVKIPPLVPLCTVIDICGPNLHVLLKVHDRGGAVWLLWVASVNCWQCSCGQTAKSRDPCISTLLECIWAGVECGLISIKKQWASVVRAHIHNTMHMHTVYACTERTVRRCWRVAQKCMGGNGVKFCGGFQRFNSN